MHAKKWLTPKVAGIDRICRFLTPGAISGVSEAGTVMLTEPLRRSF